MKRSVIRFATATLPLQALMPGSVHAEKSTRVRYSSSFQQPDPPTIEVEMTANWNQHKWNVNISNIASGYLYNSASAHKVRVDEAYDGVLGSSLFDYNNITEKGVANALWTLSPAITSPLSLWQDYVQPAFPLFEANLLIESNAVFAGDLVDLEVGEVTAVSGASDD